MINVFKSMFSGPQGAAVATPAQVSQAHAPKAPAEKQAEPSPVVLAKPSQRALMAANGSVDGFEYSLDAGALRGLTHGGAAAAVALAPQVSAVLVAARLNAMSRRFGLARIPPLCLINASPAKNEAGTNIAIDFDPSAPPSDAVIARLNRQLGYFRDVGAKVAWDVRLQLDTKPDFWVLRPSAGQSIAALLEELKGKATLIGNTPVIATDLASIEDIEQALLGGMRFAGGNMAPASAPAAPAGAKLSPDAARVAQLLGKLASGADAISLASAIKGDVGLTVKLLQQVNSARFAHLGGIASIDQALALLGRDELQRWLTVVLTQYGGQRKLSAALQEVALWRARLLELLAIERGEAHPGRVFTLGLASMLGVILKIDNTKVAATLCLPSESEQALAGTGPWHVYLRTAEHVEAQTTNDEFAVANGFTSAERLIELSAEAWAWAEANRIPAAPGNTK